MSTVILPRTPQGVFRNEPFTDFSTSLNQRAMKAALDRVGDLLGYEYPLIIDGERLHTAEKIESRNPARPAQIVGIHQNPGVEHAEAAISGGAEGLRKLEARLGRDANLAAAARLGDHSSIASSSFAHG